VLVQVPRNTLKYTLNVRGWSFANADSRLRLQMSLASYPLVASAVQTNGAETSELALRVGNTTASISVALYGYTLVYASSDSLTAPTGAYRTAGVNTSLSGDFGSILIDFPAFDGDAEVLSYDPSFGVLYGDVNTRDGTDGGGSSGNTWVIAVAVLVPLAIGTRTLPICVCVCVRHCARLTSVFCSCGQ
jgi:hypothetical protein